MKLEAKTKKFICQTLTVAITLFCASIVINLIAWQYSLVGGALTGYAIILNYIFSFPVGMTLFLINVVLLLLALIVAGKGVGIRGIIGFSLQSFFLDITRNWLGLQQTMLDNILLEILLITVLFFVMGIAVSIVIANEYNLGSYTTIYEIVNTKINIAPATLFFAFDALLALITSLLIGIENGVLLLYGGVLAYYVVKIALPKIKQFFNYVYNFN